MIVNPYVTNGLLRHDIGGCVIGTAPCGYEFTARMAFTGFDARPCPDCFSASHDTRAGNKET